MNRSRVARFAILLAALAFGSLTLFGPVSPVDATLQRSKDELNGHGIPISFHRINFEVIRQFEFW